VSSIELATLPPEKLQLRNSKLLLTLKSFTIISRNVTSYQLSITV
jgi:hypothetical protein